MPVYAKKINSAQRRAMNQYEQVSGFEFMHQDEIDSGEMTFAEAWRQNQSWFDCVASDVVNISTIGTGV